MYCKLSCTVDNMVIVAWYAASPAMTGYNCKLVVKYIVTAKLRNSLRRCTQESQS